MRRSIVKISVSMVVVLLITMAFAFTAFAAAEWISSDKFGEATHSLGENNTGKLVVEFDATPLLDNQDCVIGYADTSSPAAAFGDFNVMIRFDVSGTMDVRNGAAYEKLAEVPYTADTTYHIKSVIDLKAGTYDVWVDGKKIAESYAFRTLAPPIDDLGKVTVVTEGYDKQLKVTNHKVAPYSEAPAAGNTNPKTSDASLLTFVLMGSGSGFAAILATKKKK